MEPQVNSSSHGVCTVNSNTTSSRKRASSSLMDVGENRRTKLRRIGTEVATRTSTVPHQCATGSDGSVVLSPMEEEDEDSVKNKEMTHILLRFPDGTRVEKKLASSDRLQVKKILT